MTDIATTGLDCRGESVYIARLTDASGRPSVQTLATLERDNLAGDQSLVGSRIVFAVPDCDVMTTWLDVPRDDGYQVEDLCRFELVSSLLEPEDRFTFEILPDTRGSKFLGLTYRRESLASIDEQFGFGHKDGHSSTGYRARAVALGKGYTAFCRPEGGELICLADYSGSECSVCFVHGRDIVGLAHLPVRNDDYADDGNVRQLAIECKTVVNFKLSTLKAEGITIPLSSLLISGDGVNDRTRATFAEFFPTGVSAPRINEVYLPDSLPQDIPAENFLVAMGLTVI